MQKICLGSCSMKPTPSLSESTPCKSVWTVCLSVSHSWTLKRKNVSVDPPPLTCLHHTHNLVIFQVKTGDEMMMKTCSHPTYKDDSSVFSIHRLLLLGEFWKRGHFSYWRHFLTHILWAVSVWRTIFREWVKIRRSGLVHGLGVVLIAAVSETGWEIGDIF